MADSSLGQLDALFANLPSAQPTAAAPAQPAVPAPAPAAATAQDVMAQFDALPAAGPKLPEQLVAPGADEGHQGAVRGVLNEVPQAAIMGGASMLRGAAAINAAGTPPELADWSSKIFAAQGHPEQISALRTQITGDAAMPLSLKMPLLHSLGEAEAGLLDQPPYPTSNKLADQPLMQGAKAVEGFAQRQFPVSDANAQSIPGQLAQGLGSTLSFIPAGLLGPVGLTIAAGLSGAGQSQQAAEQFQGGTTDEQQIKAGLSGIIPGLGDALPVENLIRPLRFLPQGARTRIGQFFEHALQQALLEGGTEGAQQFLQNVFAWQTYNPDQALSEGVLQNALVGGAVGGALGGPAGLLHGEAVAPQGAPAASANPLGPVPPGSTQAQPGSVTASLPAPAAPAPAAPAIAAPVAPQAGPPPVAAPVAPPAPVLPKLADVLAHVDQGLTAEQALAEATKAAQEAAPTEQVPASIEHEAMLTLIDQGMDPDEARRQIAAALAQEASGGPLAAEPTAPEAATPATPATPASAPSLDALFADLPFAKPAAPAANLPATVAQPAQPAQPAKPSPEIFREVSGEIIPPGAFNAASLRPKRQAEAPRQIEAPRLGLPAPASATNSPEKVAPNAVDTAAEPEPAPTVPAVPTTVAEVNAALAANPKLGSDPAFLANARKVRLAAKAEKEAARKAETAQAPAEPFAPAGYLAANRRAVDAYLASGKRLSPQAVAKQLELAEPDAKALLNHLAASGEIRADGRGSFRRKAAREPERLNQFLAHAGGLDIGSRSEFSEDVHRAFVPGFGPLFRKGGMKLDEAREAASQAGHEYLPRGATVDDLVRLVEQDARKGAEPVLHEKHVDKLTDRREAKQADEEAHVRESLRAAAHEHLAATGSNFTDDEIAAAVDMSLSQDMPIEDALDRVLEETSMREEDDLATQARNDGVTDQDFDIPFEPAAGPAEPRGPAAAGGQAEAAGGTAAETQERAAAEPAKAREQPAEERGADGLPQGIIPGTEPSAKQALAARDQTGSGRKGAKVGQKDADEGLFAPAEDTRQRDLAAPEPAAKIVTASEKIASWLYDRLYGDPITWRELQAKGDWAFGGSMAQGVYSAQDLANAAEFGVNKFMDAHPETYLPIEERVANTAKVAAKIPTQTRRSDEKVALQQFSTPPDYALAAAWAAGIRGTDTVLEPSAGTGSLAVMARNEGAKSVAVNEIDPARAALLKALGFKNVTTEDAEQLDNILPESVRPTVVVMNPPFSAAGNRGVKKDLMTGARHIEQALARLQPGGRLVAIVGRGMGFKTPTFNHWWGLIRGRYSVKANIAVSGEVYRKYGTSFDTRLLVIDNTGPTLAQPVQGEADSIHALVKLLGDVRDARSGSAEQGVPEQAPAVATDVGPKGAPGAPASGNGARETGGRAGTTRVGRPSGPTERVQAERGEGPAGLSGGEQSPDAGRGREPGAVPAGNEAEGADRGGNGAAAEPAREPVGPERELPPDAVEPDDPATLDVIQQASQQGKAEDAVYETYTPQALPFKKAGGHPTPLVQSAAMGSVDFPKLTYRPKLPASVTDTGALSAAQLETVAYAGQAHSTMLTDGKTRRGFFIGDGTGVGKGREIAGIIADNFNQGRKKAIWVSKNKKLLDDATRDWTGVGGKPEQIVSLMKTKPSDKIGAKEGIVFLTYDTLKSGATFAPNATIRTRKKTGARVDQLTGWLPKDFDGVIAFDEAHGMGNALPLKGERGVSDPSARALAGLMIQREFPNARIVYVSATGATEVQNLAYAERLGLWGEGSPFANSTEFTSKIGSGGLAAMELVARDLKAMGIYTSRSLSMRDVKYDRLEHALTGEQRAIYDKLAEGWQHVLRNIYEAIEITKADGKAKSAALSRFWSMQQLFFNQVMTSMQMPTLMRSIDADLGRGDAVVLQIVNHYGSRLDAALSDAAESGEDSEFADIDLTPKQAMIDMVRNAFPVQQYEEYEDPETGSKGKRPVVDSKGKPVENKAAVAARDRLIEELQSIRVPNGPVDYLMEHLGAEKIAEVTGRSKRILFEDGRQKVENRNPDIANKAEISAFMNDKKRVLLFSMAGGTGASYHADLGAKNQRLRRHYVVQAGWIADNAIQGFGRTHRTNQKQAPEYVLVSTDLPGHKRFVSSIARRIEQLGALTKGQRQAGASVFNESDNLEGPYSAAAVRGLFTDIMNNKIPGLAIDNAEHELGLQGLFDEKTGGLNTSKLPKIQQFLNRILSATVERQSLWFGAFQARLEQQIQAAIARDELDTGLQEYKAKSVSQKAVTVVYTDPKTGSETKLYKLEATHPRPRITWAAISRSPRAREFYQNIRSGKLWGASDVWNKTEKSGAVTRAITLTGPGLTHNVVAAADLHDAKVWRKVGNRDEAKTLWKEGYDAAPATREEDLNLLSGMLLPIWNRLPDRGTIYRVTLDNGERLIGRQVSDEDLPETMERLGVGRPKIELTPEQTIDTVVRKKTAITLSNGWRLIPTQVAGETRIWLTGPSFYDEKPLFAKGVFAETHGYQRRYFVPTGEAGAEAMRAVMLGKEITKLTRQKGDEAALEGARFAVDRTSNPFTSARISLPADATGLGTRLTPEAAAKRAELIRRATNLARQMNPRVKVEFFNKLFAIGADVERSAGIEVPAGALFRVEGVHLPADGIIRLALAADRGDSEILGVAAHEGWHSVEDLLTEAERGILRRAFPSSGLRSQTEEVAYAFQDWYSNRTSGRFPGPVRAIFAKVLRFLRRFGNMLRGQGFNTVDDIFEAAHRGDVAARGEASAPGSGMVEINGTPVAGRQVGSKFAIRTYHGSPHVFDRFDISKIGTGEGNQAFGHGLYFAESQGVAKSYQHALSKYERDKITVDGKPYDISDPRHVAALQVELAGGRRKAIAAQAEALERAIDAKSPQRIIDKYKAELALLKSGEPLPTAKAEFGALYEATIHHEPIEFLDWDRPLSRQSPKVMKALQSIAIGRKKRGLFRWLMSSDYDDAFRAAVDGNGKMTGGELYRILSGAMGGGGSRRDAVAASAALREAGIPGIRYLDAGSRGAGSGTHNYVLFDDRSVTIDARYAVRRAAENPEDADAQREAVDAVYAVARGGRVHSPRDLFDDGFATTSKPVRGFILKRNLRRLAAGVRPYSDELRFRLQDKLIDTKRVQEAIQEARGGVPLPDNQNAYVKEELYHGQTGRKLEDFQRDHVDPLIQEMHRNGLSVAQVESYLYARHAAERNAKVAQINPGLDAGSGMTDEEAAKILEDFEASGKGPVLDHIGARIDAINDAKIAAMVGYGLLSPADAAQWKGAYRHYVPLKGWEDIDPDTEAELGGPGRPHAGKGFDIRGQESRRALGRRTRAADILANVLSSYEEAIVRGEKNKVGQAFLNLVLANPNKDEWEVGKSDLTRTIDKRTGLVVQRRVSDAVKPKDNVLAVKRNGKVLYITLHNHRMAKGLKNIGSDSGHALIRSIGAVMRLYARLNTSWNPEFMVSNFLRDLETAGINLQGESTKGVARAVVKDVFKAMRGAYGGLAGKEATEWQRHFRDYEKAGGSTKFFGLRDITQQRKRINQALANVDPSNLRKMMGAIGAFEKGVDRMNGAVENAIRLSTFVNLRRRGVSVDQAASAAKNLTVNFNRKGQLGNLANTFYLFFNASAQGSVRMMQALKSPRIRRLVAGVVIANAMLDILNGLLSPKDDDGTSKYDKLSPWTKDHNLILANPYAGDSSLGPVALKIPLPYGYNVFAAFGRNLGEMIRAGAWEAGVDSMGGGKFEPMHQAGALAALAMESFNPLGGDSDPLKAVIPTFLQPFYELATNRNFTGSPIQPEKQPWDKDKPSSQMAWRSTSPASKWLAQHLNAWTGGNDFRSGHLDVSPAVLDYWANYLGGATGASAKRTFDLGSKLVEGDVPGVGWNNIPFARRIVEGNNQYYLQQRFYEVADAIDAAKAETKGLAQQGDAKGSQAAQQRGAAELAVQGIWKQTAKQLKALRKQRDLIAAAPDMPSSERRQQTDQIQGLMNNAMSRALAAYNREVAGLR